jgi:hypothetical protein
MLSFARTSQPDVFRFLNTGEYFPHDGIHPLSCILAEEMKAGGVIEPYTPSTYADSRLAAYRQSITRDDFQEAVLEWIAGRPAKAQALLAKRAEIAARFPKP